MKLEIKIDGVKIKTPNLFKIDRYNITNANRTASGKATMDLIAKKRKFYLIYDVLKADEKTKILNLIDGNNMFFTVEYVEDNQLKSARCYTGEIPMELFRTGSNWVWRDVEFHFIEQ